MKGAAVGEAAAAARGAGGAGGALGGSPGGASDPRHTYYSGEYYAPVMDLTEPHFREVVQHYANRVPPAQAAAPGMAASYAAGHREVFKGSLAMGFCDVVDAPCAYLTAGLSHLVPHGALVHTRRLLCLLRLMVYRYTLAAASSLA